jgi:hypothetical protein
MSMMGEMRVAMNYRNIFQSLIILLFVISCSGQNMEPNEEFFRHSQAAKTKSQEQQKLAPVEKKSKGYVPGKILVKFKDSTSAQAIKNIQRELHLETIRLVYKPNLYLMKILDGSSVESVIERLQNYEEVKYSEPNYLRSI